jgi:tetratricopeptide (TPR) repeat protein
LGGHYGKAETLLRGALEVAQHRRDDYAVAEAQGNLGAVYQNEERMIEAERAYREALSIFRRIPDTDYETAVVLRNLGSVYSARRRDSDALKVLDEALKLAKKDSPAEAAQILNALGIVYFRQGKMSRAESLLAQAMEMRSLAGGDSDLTDAQILGNLAAIYEKQHKYGRAEESYKRALEITERRLGPVHPFLTTILGNLAGLYSEMRRYSETEDQYRRSLAILEQMSPAPNARIVLTLHWLGKNYLQQGEKTSAESTLARAVEIARRNPVPDPEMPILLDAYADILKSLGKVQDAQRPNTEARRTRRDGSNGSRTEPGLAAGCLNGIGGENARRGAPGRGSGSRQVEQRTFFRAPKGYPRSSLHLPGDLFGFS